MEKRSCGTCTKCCEGYLSGEALGHTFYLGKPCHFLAIGTGCTVYEKRPKDPCVSYKCAWLTNTDVPMWMKPSDVHAIIDSKIINGVEYFRVTEAGITLDSKVLTWAIEYALRTKSNLLWKVAGGFHWLGSSEFNVIMQKEYFPKET
jgi:hypothetical protein